MYKKNLSFDSFEFVINRTKIFDIVKAFKYQILTTMKICYIDILNIFVSLIFSDSCTSTAE